MTTPNYKKNVGRLSTDRFDFQSHIDGQKFRHKADQIDLRHALVVNGVPKNNVQDTIEALVAITSSPVVPDATLSTKGIIKLAGDLAGFATSVLVTGIFGRPLSPLAPADGNVLMWDAGGGSWKPSAATFAAGGDLTGTPSSQLVHTITGDTLKVGLNCSTILFNKTLPFSTVVGMSQQGATSGDASDMIVQAQSTSATDKRGGDVILMAGTGADTALGPHGAIRLRINASDDLVQLSQPTPDNRVLGLVNIIPVTDIQMPAGTGDGVIYIADCQTEPSVPPVTGAILYSLFGKLKVRQADGDFFPIGSLSNPSIQGQAGQQTYISRSKQTTSTGSSAIMLTFPLPDSTSTYVEVKIIGKRIASSDSAQFTLRMGYVRAGGAPVAIGTVTTVETRTVGGASAWTGLPTVTVSGNNLLILSGANGSTTINWFSSTRLDMDST